MINVDFIKKRISEGDNDEAFKSFLELIEQSDYSKYEKAKSIYSEVILLSGRYKAIGAEYRMGMLTEEKEQVEKNKVSLRYKKFLKHG